MSYRTLTVEVADRLATVTISRPEVRNALSRQVLADLRTALAVLRDDDEVGAVVFTGAGDKAFVAGADISQLQEYTPHTGLEAEMQRLFDEIEAFDKPTIAAVNGFALGGGCELAMSCDIRIAADTARFGLPETIGPVTSVVPQQDLFTAARELADRILAKGPLSVRLARLVIRTGMNADQRTGLVVERLAQALLYTADDKREGARAFLEKRPAAFRGR